MGLNKCDHIQRIREKKNIRYQVWFKYDNHKDPSLLRDPTYRTWAKFSNPSPPMVTFTIYV